MLTHLFIKNFAIIAELDIDMLDGLSVITGETGAGKSIAIEALELALGRRADSQVIRQGEEKTEITATFDVSQITLAQSWLQEHELNNENECIVRRILDKNGRSKISVNGSPVTAAQIKALAELLINIHGQHEHQSLLKHDYQLQLLDDFANHSELLQTVKEIYREWRDTQKQLDTLQHQTGKEGARIELLQYQLQEFDELGLQQGEVVKLHQEQKTLANADSFIQNCQAALDCLTESETAASYQLNRASQSIVNNEQIKVINELILSALVQTEEAANELRHYLDKLDLDPARLNEVEQRLNKIHHIARKHHIEPEKLLEHHQALALELDQLKNVDQHVARLKQQLENLSKRYQTAAAKLTKSRSAAAKKLSTLIQEKMHLLGMPGGKLEISLQPNKDNSYAPFGLEHAEFLVAINPGQPLQPLNKVASGGELSRISLAIQVITAQTTVTPTLVFDEVDVGIGGGTADIVGDLLKTLGRKAQVICITHLPQVAAKGHHHFQVQKTTDGKTTTTQLIPLTSKERELEIARMLGGVTITETTLAHAKEMLKLS